MKEGGRQDADVHRFGGRTVEPVMIISWRRSRTGHSDPFSLDIIFNDMRQYMVVGST